MFRYLTDDNSPTGNITEINPRTVRAWCRWDIESFEHAEQLARQATEITGRTHIAVGKSAYVSPRFDVIEPPRVGEPVSYAFNGDYYPDGVVTHVTEGTFRVVKTDTGSVYYRRKQTDTWLKKGGTWALVKGHVSERNPHF